MLTVFHGDDEVKIHQALSQLLQESNVKGISIRRLDAKGLTIADLETAAGTEELFSTQKVVIIDRLHSLPKSKQKDTLVDWIASFRSSDIQVFLVENKILTATQLKKFKDADVKLYKLPQLLFAFLENIGITASHLSVTAFHSVLEHQEPEQVFAMLIRQIRMLLMYVADGVYEGPPFGRAKITKQARNFSLEKLLEIHHRLVEIDLGQKTSSSPLSLTQEIDLLLLEL